jgi:NADPH-dependent F420 reductase
MSKTNLPVIAVVGGTGKLGGALAGRWARAGYRVWIGSRDSAKAQSSARALTEQVGHTVEGASYGDAAAKADIVVVAVPSESQGGVLQEIRPHVAGKLVIDTTVPLVPPKVMRVQLPPEGSAAQRAQGILGPSVTLVAAFHNVAAHKLATDATIDCDVLVFGDDKAARERVVGLCSAASLRGIHAGALANSAAAEALTSVLIFINKTYSVDGAGVRITGALVPPTS